MIGIFDSGLGGLTVLRALSARFPNQAFCYLGDHANMPYGERTSDDVVALTRAGVEHLFNDGARLVVLGCNTATAVAARSLQQNWLPTSQWPKHNVVGIVAPTVEAATQTPWAVTTPQYPQKYNDDTIAVFATTRTIAANVYAEEIRKRCPRVIVHQQPCAGLAGAIEDRMPLAQIDEMVAEYVTQLLHKADGQPINRAILGCTHYPIIEDVFRRHLPSTTRLLSQPDIVSDSLEDYLARHPEYVSGGATANRVRCFTTGDAVAASKAARVFWQDAPMFEARPVE
ncbi:MAG: glutamate racemase [Hyphomicrobiaceae bacterium]